MWIAADNLMFSLAIFLNFIEIISSQAKTLEDLFPGCSGVMPPLEQFLYEGQPSNFKTYNGQSMTATPSYLVRRAHIIFGCKLEGDTIRDPSFLFPNLNGGYIAFDMDADKWITITCDLYWKLGTNRLFELAVAHEQVAATHVLTSKNPIYKKAHIRALKEANDRVPDVEKEQRGLLFDKKTTPENSIIAIKEQYSEAYNRAFMLDLHQHGEYHIHGFRERRPETNNDARVTLQRMP